MDNNSAGSNLFGFNKPNADKVEQKDTSVVPPVEKVNEDNVSTSVAGVTNERDSEYTDIRNVTIKLVKSYSLYRKINDKALPKRKDFIGSSIHSSRILSANKEEVDTYFPNIVGLSPSDPSFIKRVKQYLNNIRIPVDELGRTFNISFRYNHKSDYTRIKKEEDAIEREYKLANKSDIKKIKDALKIKIVKLNALESSKCKLGYPIDIDDYLMYRHCLLYNDVAKEVALINSDTNIRFYFQDNQKEEEKAKKYRFEVNRAKGNYVACIADNNLFDAVYIQYCVINNMPVISSLAENKLDREIKLDKFSTDEPVKFNKIFANKDVKLIADIELLIARGELIRSEYNQNISSPDGEFIGANMTEAIAWFKNVDNTSIVNALYNKLRNI